MEKPSDGYIVFCKRACETCATVVTAMKEIAEVITSLTVFCQDDPGFPEGLPGVVDDTALETSFYFDIEAVPTLIRMENGQETGRAVGWDRAESLARTYALCLRNVAHPKIPMAADAMLVVSPEHGRIFSKEGWTKSRLREELDGLLQFPGADLVRGAGGIAEGVPEELKDATVPKFRPDGLHIVHAGGTAGLFSAIIGGWVASGPKGSQSVTKEVRS